MQYPIPSYKETKELLKFYSKFRRSPKHKARAQLEYMKSILEDKVKPSVELCTD